jgi:RNA polymerase-binding transcription factor DksA
MMRNRSRFTRSDLKMNAPRRKTMPANRVQTCRKRASSADVLSDLDRSAPERERIKPKWAWHFRVLLRLRARLLQDRGSQRDEALQQLEAWSMSMADAATDEFDHDLALAALSAEQNALYEVEAAIRRIVNGTYGVCEVSGEPIPAARLKAVPWTRFTQAVELRLEQEGALTRVGIGKLHSAQGAHRPALAAAPEELEGSEARMEEMELLGKDLIRQREKELMEEEDQREGDAPV